MAKVGCVPLLLALLGLRVGGETPRPVKLQVDLPSKSVSLGERAGMNVILVDADNRPVPAPKDFTVDIVARLPSNATETLTSAVLKAGQSSMRVELPPAKAEGFLYIWAKQPELRLGGAYLRVKPSARSQTGGARPPSVAVPPLAQPPRLQRAPETSSQSRAEVEKRPATSAIPAAKIGQMKPEISRPAGSVAEVARSLPPSLPVAVAAEPAGRGGGGGGGAGGGYLLALRYSPQRAFLANGKDPATVHAFVMARREGPLPGFRVRLFDSSGTMAPVPLVIPPGEEEGTATLTSDREGPVKVEYLSSTPVVELDGDKVMNVTFEPPIVGFEVQPSPPRISLVDTCDLVLRLVDENGTPIATKTRRTVSLALLAGRGEFSAREVPIEPDSSTARVTFTPVWWGPVTVTASTPNLVNVSAGVQVNPPLALLGFSLAGGLLGGYVFMLKRGKSKRWRVPLGALTGVILLWACLFLGLGVLPRAAVLNPMSVFVISVVGGWLGTGVFEPILKRLGFETAAA
jgi:hypothetical protein